MLLGRETIYRDGERVGWLGSGGYGHTLQANIGYGYVRRPRASTREYLLAGRYELEVATERVALPHPSRAAVRSEDAARQSAEYGMRVAMRDAARSLLACTAVFDGARRCV